MSESMRSELAEAVRARILSDMRPSLPAIYLKSGLAVVLGGAASLLVCGQFGLGITHVAMHLNNQFHGHVDDLGSALGCGIIFALIPPCFLRLLCSPLQFQILTRRSLHAAFVWIVGLGGVLAHHGDTGIQILAFVIWCVAASGTFWFVARLINRFGRTWSLPWATV